MSEGSKLSTLLIEQINAVTQNQKERKFLESILEKELFYYSNENLDEIRKEYRILMETYFPFQKETEAKEQE